MRIRNFILVFSLLTIGMASAQLDVPQEGISIKPSDDILKTDYSQLFQLSPILGLTNKNIVRKIRYNPFDDAFKRTSGVNIAETSKLKKPSWEIKEQFAEIKGNLSEFEKDFDLGSAETTSKTIIIQCRDSGRYIDGDTVKLMINDAVLIPKITMGGDFYSIDVELKEGVNYISFTALNEGAYPPNTAYFRVYDENGVAIHARNWYMSTGFKAVFTVIKK